MAGKTMREASVMDAHNSVLIPEMGIHYPTKL